MGKSRVKGRGVGQGARKRSKPFEGKWNRRRPTRL